MLKPHSMLCSVALVALLPLAGCASDGRVSTSGGFGASAASAPSGGGSGDGGDTGEDSSSDGGAEAMTFGSAVVASSGNLGDAVSEGDPESFDDSISPLARVSLANESITSGSDRSALGLSAASDTQEQGDVATFGVLSGGEVITADTQGLSNGASDLVGVTADGEQVVGEGDEQLVGIGAASPNDASGEVASVNLLNDPQTADIHVDGATTSLVEDVTAGLGSLTQGVN